MSQRRSGKRDKDRFFGRWIAARWPFLLLALTIIAVFALVNHLYRGPNEAWLYGAEIALALLICAGSWDYLRLRARHRALTRLMDALPESLSHLPEPMQLIEADYQALLNRMAALRGQALTRQDQRYQALSDYALRFSHEVKTPIAAGRLLLRGLKDDERLPLQDELFKIERQVDMMLNFFRLDGSMDDFIFAPCSLRDIASEAARHHARFFVLKKLSLKIDIPEALRIKTDGKMLRFVLEQLISNAVKYTDQGGVSLLWIEDDRSLVIRDTGPGIAPEDLPRVMEQGYTGRLGRAHQRATGMGLYLSRMACQRLGIHLSIQSSLGEGTKVILRFGQELDTRDG